MTPVKSDPARRIRRARKDLSGAIKEILAQDSERVSLASRMRGLEKMIKNLRESQKDDVDTIDTLNKTIAEQKARIDELEKRLKDIEIERQDEAYERMERMTFPE